MEPLGQHLKQNKDFQKRLEKIKKDTLSHKEVKAFLEEHQSELTNEMIEYSPLTSSPATILLQMSIAFLMICIRDSFSVYISLIVAFNVSSGIWNDVTKLDSNLCSSYSILFGQGKYLVLIWSFSMYSSGT